MSGFLKWLWRLLRELPLVLLSPIFLLLGALALFLESVVAAIGRRPALEADRAPDTRTASVVIPNWNGKDLLAKYLPSVLEALAGNPANEVIIVDNASTDGSA